MNSAELESTFQQGITDYQAGELSRAMSAFKSVLATNPRHARSLHMLGILALQTKNYALASGLIAESLDVEPNNADALCNLGNALRGEGKFEKAEIALRGSLSLAPDQAGVWSNLNDLLLSLGRPQEAVEAGQQALSLDTTSADIYCNLGSAYIHTQQYEKAIQILKQGLQLEPQHVLMLVNLGLAYDKVKDWHTAAQHYEQALSIAPQFIDAYNNYATMLRGQGKLSQAKNLLERALSLQPDHYLARYHYADLLFELADFDGSIENYQLAIDTSETADEARFGLSFALLITGQYKEGWRHYLWRDLAITRAHYHKYFPDKPEWRGTSLKDKTIVILSEQGYGDSIQFVRYINQLASFQPKKVVLAVPQALLRLFSSIASIDMLVTEYSKLVDHDYFCPLLNLPVMMDTDLDSIPSTVPYLAVDDKRSKQWQVKLTGLNGLKVGIAWQGNPANITDYKRSVAFDNLKPLFNLDGISWVSLQVGAQINDHVINSVTDLTSDLSDFAETAALISQLDLVITVCTSIAHLAGALNKPTWIMLAHVADWRWLRDRNDSPWYPSVTLFRQQNRNEWQPVIDNVRQRLTEIVKNNVVLN